MHHTANDIMLVSGSLNGTEVALGHANYCLASATPVTDEDTTCIEATPGYCLASATATATDADDDVDINGTCEHQTDHTANTELQHQHQNDNDNATNKAAAEAATVEQEGRDLELAVQCMAMDAARSTTFRDTIKASVDLLEACREVLQAPVGAHAALPERQCNLASSDHQHEWTANGGVTHAGGLRQEALLNNNSDSGVEAVTCPQHTSAVCPKAVAQLRNAIGHGTATVPTSEARLALCGGTDTLRVKAKGRRRRWSFWGVKLKPTPTREAHASEVVGCADCQCEQRLSIKNLAVEPAQVPTPFPARAPATTIKQHGQVTSAKPVKPRGLGKRTCITAKDIATNQPGVVKTSKPLLLARPPAGNAEGWQLFPALPRRRVQPGAVR